MQKKFWLKRRALACSLTKSCQFASITDSYSYPEESVMLQTTRRSISLGLQIATSASSVESGAIIKLHLAARLCPFLVRRHLVFHLSGPLFLFSAGGGSNDGVWGANLISISAGQKRNGEEEEFKR